jgi:hypothetical protein
MKNLFTLLIGCVTEMSITGPEIWLFLALLLIGGIAAYLKRK